MTRLEIECRFLEDECRRTLKRIARLRIIARGFVESDALAELERRFGEIEWEAFEQMALLKRLNETFVIRTDH